MSCDLLELEILDEYEQEMCMNLDFNGDILYLLDQSVSKDTLTIKHIHLEQGQTKETVLENYINCMGTISGNGEFLSWYESYDAGEFMSIAGLQLKTIQYITYLDGELRGHRFRRLQQYDWSFEDYVWTEWSLQENSYVTNVGQAMSSSHLYELIKNDNIPYFFTTGAGLSSTIGSGPFVGARHNNIISCSDITNGTVWEIDLNNNEIIDLSNNETSIIYLNEEFLTKEDIANYPFETNKLYHFIIPEWKYPKPKSEFKEGPYICFCQDFDESPGYYCIDIFNYREQESYHIDKVPDGTIRMFQYYEHPDLSPYVKTQYIEIQPEENIDNAINQTTYTADILYFHGVNIEPIIIEQKKYSKNGPTIFDYRLNRDVNAERVQIKILTDNSKYQRFLLPGFWIDTDDDFSYGSPEWTEWEQVNLTSINIDQTYSPESSNAQSGIAVAEALNNIKNVIDAGKFAAKEDLKNYKFEVGKVYTFKMSDELAVLRSGAGYCMGYITDDDVYDENDNLYRDVRLHYINLTTGLGGVYYWINDSFDYTYGNYVYLGYVDSLSGLLSSSNIYTNTFYMFTCEWWHTDDYYHPMLGTIIFNSDGDREWRMVDLFNGKRYGYSHKVGPINISETEILDVVRGMSPFKPQNLYMVSYDSLFGDGYYSGMNGKVLQARPQWGSFEGSTTGIDLPYGTYLAIRALDYNVVSCWSLTDNTLYTVTRNETEMDGETVVSYAVTSSKDGLVTKEELNTIIGDIETLLASI